MTVKVGDEVLGGRVTKITALNEGLEVQVLVPHTPVEEDAPAVQPDITPDVEVAPAAAPVPTGDAIKKTTTKAGVRK